MTANCSKNVDSTIGLAIVAVVASVIFVFVPWNQLNHVAAFGYQIDIGRYSDFAQYISGITSPLLSLAAFVLLYRTYVMQKEELTDQRALLESQKKLLDDQTELAKKRNFDDTFYKLVSVVENQFEAFAESYARAQAWPEIGSEQVANKILRSKKISMHKGYTQAANFSGRLGAFCETVLVLLEHLVRHKNEAEIFHRRIVRSILTESQWQLFVLYVLENDNSDAIDSLAELSMIGQWASDEKFSLEIQEMNKDISKKFILISKL